MAMSDKDKKAKQYEREKEALAKFGGARLKMIMYQSELDALERACVRYGFKGQQRRAECMAHIIQMEDQRHATDLPK